jgi:hypothetical protein
VTWNSSANRMNSQFVLRKCPKGFTGYECRFDYDYFFRIKIENLPEPIYMNYWIPSKLNESIIPPSID